MSVPTLALRDLRLRYSPSVAPLLDGLDLQLTAGEHVALLGLNGSGKTSLLRCLVGLQPCEGEIRICGERVEAKSLAEIRSKIGFLFNVPEDQLLLPTPLEDVAFGLRQRGSARATAESQARAALRSLGVEDLADADTRSLSHGQAQRVALAGLLALEPPLLLLDEPSAALDPPARRRLAALLAAQPAALLLATHDLELAERCCSRFVLLEGGRLVLDGPDLGALRARWG